MEPTAKLTKRSMQDRKVLALMLRPLIEALENLERACAEGTTLDVAGASVVAAQELAPTEPRSDDLIKRCCGGIMSEELGAWLKDEQAATDITGEYVTKYREMIRPAIEASLAHTIELAAERLGGG